MSLFAVAVGVLLAPDFAYGQSWTYTAPSHGMAIGYAGVELDARRSFLVTCGNGGLGIQLDIAPRPDTSSKVVLKLGLEIDRKSYSLDMVCNDGGSQCAAGMSNRERTALRRGRSVRVYYDGVPGPTFPLTGAADAIGKLSHCPSAF